MKLSNVALCLIVSCGVVLLDVSESAAQSTGPVAAYAFSEGTGTTTADASGNGNTGTLVNGPSWAAGYVGGGLTFDGSSGAVQVPTSETLASVQTAFTLEAWVRPTDLSTYRDIVSRRDQGLNLYLSPGGTPT